MNKKKIMVIDGNSLMHRAYYAIPTLTNRKGIHTNAIYGFVNVLLKLLEDYKPEYIGVAFDKKAPTFRHKEYKEYKGTRQKTPEELVPQFDILKELLTKMNIAIYEIDGYEADDILGTFARIAEEEGLYALLVTGDRDALQLVSQNTHVLLTRTRKGISEVQLFDLQEVKNTYNLTPEQIIDLKGLMGDSSDNIPGVPGVGEKTALKLLHQYSTVENVLEHIDEISSKKLRENLATYREQAILSKKLATIVRDVPVDIKLEDCCYTMPKTTELRELLEELEFNSILKKLGFDDGAEVKPKNGMLQKEIIPINDSQALENMVVNLVSVPLVSILVGEEITIASKSQQVYRISLRKDLIDDGMDFAQVMQQI
jgi:5'-3' exonuclease, C-terminal SAM fold./5'-3' exonuclease, N-terminal resolvase-like domain.